MDTRRTAQLAGLLVLAALTGCGTTVQGSQLATDGGVGPAGASTALDAGAGLDPAAVPSSGEGGTAAAAPGAGAAPAGGPASGTGASSGAGRSARAGQAPTTPAGAGRPGVGPPAVASSDRSPVTVAVFHLNGGNQVLSAAFPGSSVSFGDGKREATALIEELNRHGGAGGHPVVPKFVAVEATKANNTGLGAACQGAVQDYHPMAIFAMFNLAEGLSTCAQKYGVLLLDVALGAGDDAIYAAARDHVFSPSQMSRDAEQDLVLTTARAAGRLPAGKPVGILVQDDDPSYGRVADHAIEPRLRALGVPFVRQSISTGADTNGINAAILKFSSAGVRTVVFSLGNGGIPEVLFMQSAEQQQYRPAYLMGDSTDTSFVSSQAPKAQLKGITGAGTYPLANVAASEYPSTPTEKACLATLNRAIGGYTNRSSSLTGTLYCELVSSFAHVAARVSGPLTASSWAAAYHASGVGYRPVTTFSTRFTPGSSTGAASYRLLGYGAGCSCITYTSPVRPVPAG